MTKAETGRESPIMDRKAIEREAAGIAGCGYEDYVPDGTPPERMRACARCPASGTVGEYTQEERERLLTLAGWLERLR